MKPKEERDLEPYRRVSKMTSGRQLVMRSYEKSVLVPDESSP